MQTPPLSDHSTHNYLVSTTMAKPKLTLFVDIVSPFAYLAFYLTKVGGVGTLFEDPNDKEVLKAALLISCHRLHTLSSTFPIDLLL